MSWDGVKMPAVVGRMHGMVGPREACRMLTPVALEVWLRLHYVHPSELAKGIAATARAADCRLARLARALRELERVGYVARVKSGDKRRTKRIVMLVRLRLSER